jgi:hypothetical protein
MEVHIDAGNGNVLSVKHETCPCSPNENRVRVFVRLDEPPGTGAGPALLCWDAATLS